MRHRKIYIPIVAMSDIAFLLLIFLMVSSIILQKKTIKLNLPEIEDVTKVSIKRCIHISIDKEGEYYFGNKKMPIEELEAKIETETALDKEMIIFVYGDEDTEYDYVDKIIKILQANNLRNAVFISRRLTKEPR